MRDAYYDLRSQEEPSDWPYRWFRPAELRCRHCGHLLVHVSSLAKLDAAREYSGISWPVNSGYRCAIHNRAVGGAVNSQHLVGRAFDIEAGDFRTRWEVIRAASRAGFDGIGIYPRFVHIDTGPKRFWTQGDTVEV